MKKSHLLGFSALLLFFSSPSGAQIEAIKPVLAKKDLSIDFHVKWDGRVVPGITFVSGLKRKTQVLENRGGGDPSLMRRSPGINEYEPIVLKRPRSSDKMFEQWANKTWNFGSGLGSEVSLNDFRKDIIVELCDKDGRVLMSFKVYRCWPSEYVALSDLDVNDPSPAMETLVLEHEGWERDYTIH